MFRRLPSIREGLTQSFHLSVHNIDFRGLRHFGQAGHTHDFAHDDDYHLRAVVDDDVAHLQLEVADCAVGFRVRTEGILRLGDADGIVRNAERGDLLQLLFRQGGVRYRGGTVDAFRNLADFRAHVVGVFVGEAERLGGMVFDGVGHEARQFDATVAAFGKDAVLGETDTHRAAVVGDEGDFFVGIRVEAVEGYDDLLSETAHILNMFVEIGKASLDALDVRQFDIRLGDTAVEFQTLRRRHDDGNLRLESRLAAFDVEELLCTEVGTETRFGDDIIGIRERHLRCDDGVATVGDVGKRTAVDESRRVLGRLHEVGQKRVFQQDRDGAGDTQVVYRERFIVVGVAQEDIPDATLEVVEVRGEAEDGHDFRSRSDVEARLGRYAIDGTAQAGDDVAQATVVYVQDTFPLDFLQTETSMAILIQMVVEQCRNHVVSRGNGVEIAREVEVDVLHWEDLCVSASCCATLHAETRAEGRFAKDRDRLLPDFVQTERETDGDGSLTDARLGGRDGGNEDEVVLADALLVDEMERDFGDVATVVEDFIARDAEAFGDVFDFLQRGFSGYVDISFHIYNNV